MRKALWRMVLLAATTASIVACSTSRPIQSEADLQNALMEFRNGNASLNCNFGCGWPWYSNRQALYSLYAGGQWQRLSLHVMQIGHTEDLGYFWLGRAAEELGYPQAAQSYYRAALILHPLPNMMSCRNVRSEGCFGIDIAGEASQRLASLVIPRGRSPEVPSLSGPFDRLPEDPESPSSEPVSPVGLPPPLEPAARDATGHQPRANNFPRSPGVQVLSPPSPIDLVLPPARR